MRLLAATAATATPVHKHAAAIVRSGKIIAIACNTTYHHAEENALRIVRQQQVKREEAVRAVALTVRNVCDPIIS